MIKKFLFTIVGFLFAISVAIASNFSSSKIRFIVDSPYRFAEPVAFIEGGVEFLIFPDGTFEFNTIANDAIFYTSNVKHSRRTEAPYAAKRPRIEWMAYDASGAVSRIGNVLINYDNNGRITDAGSIRIEYHKRNNILKRVGNLKVNFNDWGEVVHYKGSVNKDNLGTSYFIAHQTPNYIIDNYETKLNSEYHYYKNNGKVKKLKKHKKNKK